MPSQMMSCSRPADRFLKGKDKPLDEFSGNLDIKKMFWFENPHLEFPDEWVCKSAQSPLNSDFLSKSQNL